MPDLAAYLDLFATLRPLQDLAGRVAAPKPTKLTTQRA
jgi:hypothetical protein